jgi:hypothetical protein
MRESLFKRYLKNTYAMAAVEFALSVPFLMASLYGVYELTNFMLATGRVQDTAYVLSQMLSDSRLSLGPCRTDLRRILNAVPQHTLGRYNKQIEITISARDSTGLSWVLRWSANSPSGNELSRVVSTNVGVGAPSQITVEVRYTYVPALSNQFLAVGAADGQAPTGLPAFSRVIRKTVMCGPQSGLIPVVC